MTNHPDSTASPHRLMPKSSEWPIAGNGGAVHQPLVIFVVGVARRGCALLAAPSSVVGETRPLIRCRRRRRRH